MIVTLAGALAASLASCPPADAALALGITTPTVALSLNPGATATASGTIVVTPGIGTWSVSAADTTGHAGHLAQGAGCLAAGEALTANALSVAATGIALGTSSSGTKTISGSAQAVATGTLADTLTLSYGLVVGSGERLPFGCVYSTTVTYTLQ